MVIATELFSRMSGLPDPAPEGAHSGGFDWHGLHARLAAAHAARGALHSSDSRTAAISGGFSALRAGNHPSRDVNPTGLADGKAPTANDCAIAGQTLAGGRGQ